MRLPARLSLHVCALAADKSNYISARKLDAFFVRVLTRVAVGADRQYVPKYICAADARPRADC